MTPEVILTRLRTGAENARGLVVIIDVFRAFTTACHVMARSPSDYWMVNTCAAARAAQVTKKNAILIGKSELGSLLQYNIPNSPTLASALPLAGKSVIHRSGAGAAGVLAAIHAREVVTGSFVNVGAVVRYIQGRRPALITLVSMGHEAGQPSLEDELCARLLKARLQGQPFDPTPHFSDLRDGPGRYFFNGVPEYPREDFDSCLTIDRFDFILRARLEGAQASLERVD